MALGHAERLLVRQYETDVSLGTGSLMLAHAADGLFPRQGKARRQCLCPVWPLIHRQRIFSLIGPAKRVCRLLYERPLQHGHGRTSSVLRFFADFLDLGQRHGSLCCRQDDEVKLCPSISPGKTREGAIGGFVGTLIVAVVFSLIFQFSILHALALGIIIGIMAPLGDLAESILKRVSGVKDSGNIIPGHGGVLDRFDSLLFAAPAMYVYLMLVI